MGFQRTHGSTIYHREIISNYHLMMEISKRRREGKEMGERDMERGGGGGGGRKE